MAIDVASEVSDVLHDVEGAARAFREGAAKVRDAGRSDLAARLDLVAIQRRAFAEELTRLAAVERLDLRDRGGLGDVLHRGLASVREALHSDPTGTVLSIAAQADERALTTVQRVLVHQDRLPVTVRTVLSQVVVDLRTTGDEVRSLRSLSR
jgi:uncharacterized protein (TIGR02284 family)